MKKAVFLSSIILPVVLFLSAAAAGNKAADWSYRNAQEGYLLRLPEGVKKNFARTRQKEEAARDFLPYDYVNFGMAGSGAAAAFELGLGVHWNSRGLDTRRFADAKDAGVRMGVKQYVTKSSSEVIVAGIKGVRDDFALEKPDGWHSYSRVIIPLGDRFFCFLCTLGTDTPVPAYEHLFARILEGFQLERGR
jgi:hypothetical protein